MEHAPSPQRAADARGWALKADRNGFTFRIGDASLANNARSMFQRYLSTQVDDDSDLYGAELIFGELLGNVARHAPGTIAIHLRWNGLQAILEVADTGPGYSIDEVQLPSDLSESARGLFLVAAYGHDLRVERHGGRTTTTVTLPVKRRRNARSA